jgi:hypothetical protein
MKGLSLILGIMMLTTVFAVPVYAMGGGMGGGMAGSMGGGMTDNFGSGLLDWFQEWRNGDRYTNQRPQEGQQTDELDQQHYEDSTYLKYQIEMKEKELDALLNSKDPDIEKARTLNRDIRALRAEADREERNYELQAGRMNPGYQSGGRNGWASYGSSVGRGSRGMGNAGGMGDYGSGRR